MLFKHIIALFGLFSILRLSAQQELMLHSLTDMWHTNSLNPALFPEGKRFALGLPAFSLDAAHSGDLTYNDFFRQEGDRTILDLGKAIDRLDPENEVFFDRRLETVSLGLRSRDDHWGLQLSHAIQLNGFVRYPKSLAEVLWNGNAPYVGQTLQIAPSASIFDWHEWSVGLSRRVGKLSLGARAKFLTGAGMLKTDEAHKVMEVYTDPDIYQLHLRSDYAFHSAQILTAIDTAGLGFDIETGSLSSKPSFSNKGIAFDLGIEAKLSERLSVNAAVLNLGGSIKWEKEVSYFKSSAQYVYEGAEVSGLDIINGADSIDFDAKIDTLNDIFKFSKTASSVSTDLPLRVLAGGTFQLSGKWSLGVNVLYQNSEGRSNTAAGVSIRWRPLRWCSLGAMYSANSRSASNVGFHLALQPGPVQVYLLSDNLLNAFSLKSSPAVNFRVGAAVAF